jgi:hypothetical protein
MVLSLKLRLKMDYCGSAHSKLACLLGNQFWKRWTEYGGGMME